MKISYNWLQTYFKEKLPAPQELADLLTFHVFEIEGIEQKGNDTVIDVKVLPDRAHYALCHRGIAQEISAITLLPLEAKETLRDLVNGTHNVSVIVTEKELCPRYVARIIEEISVKSSPQWLKDWLEAVGQRSINTIVDATNFVMLDMGQPLHAFDASKVKGGITVRLAKAGEKITTLDGKDVELDSSILVIADDEGPLAIAGVKGGSRAAVTEQTQTIILESACFNPTQVRKASQKVGIRNDSSKRFENSVPAERSLKAIEEVTALIATLATPKTIGPVTDVYSVKQEPVTVRMPIAYVNELLGVTIPPQDIEHILKRLTFNYTLKDNELHINVPFERLDLVSPRDMVEEIGRLYGYKNISATPLPETTFTPAVNKLFFYSNKIRDILVDQNFSEVYTYSLANEGIVEIQNPLASDKKYLRPDLVTGLKHALEFNTKHADLLGLKQIRIFEIGTVFTEEGEHTSLALGIKNAQKTKDKEGDVLQEILKVMGEHLGIDMSFVEVKDGVAEIHLDNLLRNLPDPNDHASFAVTQHEKKFAKISSFPFAVRDIAVFVPQEVTEDMVRKLITDSAGVHLVRTTLFDVFEKSFPDGSKKTSYAFRLVFQSHEKTLTEEEITKAMSDITQAMHSQNGWQVR